MISIINLKIVDEFYITGRGLVFTLSLKENGLQGTEGLLGSVVNVDGKLYRINGVECSKGLFLLDRVGVNVKEAKK